MWILLTADERTRLGKKIASGPTTKTWIIFVSDSRTMSYTIGAGHESPLDVINFMTMFVSRASAGQQLRSTAKDIST